MRYFSSKAIHFYGLVICSFMLVAAMYFQFYVGLEPCPLCMLQRMIVVLLGLLFFIGMCIHPPFWARVHNLITAAVGGLGIAAAGRHIWLQHLPEGQAPACGPELEYLLRHFSLQEALSIVLQGTADCADVQWQFLSFSMAEWTFGFFILLTGLALINLVRTK